MPDQPVWCPDSDSGTQSASPIPRVGGRLISESGTHAASGLRHSSRVPSSFSKLIGVRFEFLLVRRVKFIYCSGLYVVRSGSRGVATSAFSAFWQISVYIRRGYLLLYEGLNQGAGQSSLGSSSPPPVYT